MSPRAIPALCTLFLANACANHALPVEVALTNETLHEEPEAFVALAGNWSVVEDDGARAVLVDGTSWAPGTPPEDLEAKARLLYPGVAAFPGRVLAGLNFQLAVARDISEFRDGRIRVDFKLIGGESDQYASIMFGMQPDANYHALRYNTRDNNLAVWRVVDGERERVHNGTTPVLIPLGEWHTLELAVSGTLVEGFIDGQKELEYSLDHPVPGRVGFWTKPDSVTAFRNFTVEL